jgi:hypothetical protein
MNALQKIKDMEATFRNAGFDVQVKEEDDMYFVSATNNAEFFGTSKHFIMMAGKTYGTNKWHKRLSVTEWGLFTKMTEKKDLSYADMWSEINYAIRYEKAVQSGKVGA